MRPRSLLLLALALGCGLVASIGISQVMDRGPSTPTASGPTDKIFVAKVNIPFGAPIKPEMIQLEEWPKGKVPVGALKKIDDIENRRAKHPLVVGEPILKSKLLAIGEGAGPSDRVPDGFVVSTIRVAAEHGANLIRVGDRVDMQVYIRQGTLPQVTEAMTRTFLHNIRVFAVGQQYRLPENEEKLHTAKTVSLLVTPEQAEKITLASKVGDIRLVMRSASDETIAPARGVRVRDVVLGESERNDNDRPDTGDENPGPADIRDWLTRQMAGAGNSTPTTAVSPEAPFVMVGLVGTSGPMRFTFDDPNQLPREVARSATARAAAATDAPPQSAAPAPDPAPVDPPSTSLPPRPADAEFGDEDYDEVIEDVMDEEN